MSEKRIVIIGFEIASSKVKLAPFRSKSSLLDFDIVLFRPDIDDFVAYVTGSFQGKPSLSDTESFHLRECCEHWRRELKEAKDAGKTVIVFLSELKSIYVDTGTRTYSGTGRNQKTTRIVAEYSNYEAIPAELGPVVANGAEMKLASSAASALATFWSEFREMFSYHVLLTSAKVPTAVVTRTGDKSVGAFYGGKASAGTLVLLPDIDFFPDDFFSEKNDEQTWTKKALSFANRFLDAVIQFDRSLRAESESTPEPNWASSDFYHLAPERELRAKLNAAELAAERAQREKEDLSERLRSEGRVRGLLFEKGKPLEDAIVEALSKLGFIAAQHKEGDSEFDVVFESSEGRLIGEAEGKDSKPVNVDKLRQLQMNIHEDLLRESVSKPAKPVLFGNSYRLSDPTTRGEPFTEKCVASALTMNTALVSTPDLFLAVQHYLDSDDTDFAAACRASLLSTVGLVIFPTPDRHKAIVRTELDLSVE